MCNFDVKALFTFKFSNIDNPPFFQTCFINACASDTLLSWKRGTLQGNDVAYNVAQSYCEEEITQIVCQHNVTSFMEVYIKYNKKHNN